VYGPAPLSALADEGRIELHGDGAEAQRFVDRFGLKT